jgi:hypothetical protein
MVTVAVLPPFFLTVSELALAVSLHPPGPVPVIGVEVPAGVVLQSTAFGRTVPPETTAVETMSEFVLTPL